MKPRSFDKRPGHIVVPIRSPRTRSKILSSMVFDIDETRQSWLNKGGNPPSALVYMKLLSWNVNGVRAALRYGLLDYLARERADIVCLQETRCHIDAMAPLAGGSYHIFLNPAQKAGYSGTAILSYVVPRAVFYGIGLPEHDDEGRVLTAEYADFYLVNVYVPNAKDGLLRLPYRQMWDAAFLAYVRALEENKPVVFCGDLNVAHTPLDLARAKQNVGNKGFTAEERAGFDAYVAAGFCDTFRVFEPGAGHYSWWSRMAGARTKNVGWRIDYFLVSAALRPRLRAAFIRPEVTGSDHCPVGIELDVASPPVTLSLGLDSAAS